MRNAKALLSDLSLGICAPLEVLQESKVLDVADDLEASVLAVEVEGDSFKLREERLIKAADLIYEKNLQLSTDLARAILDRNLQRALAEIDRNRKGVLLEVTIAVMLSQVPGFDVVDRGISSRNEEFDVFVHNRNVGGILAGSPIVLAEGKNWTDPVGRPEYDSFARKLLNRRRRARLGFLVTTGRFTEGVGTETVRDSHEDELVVLLDGEALPAVWRAHDNIASGVERAIIQATIDQ
jgi:hypothetical protein